MFTIATSVTSLLGETMLVRRNYSGTGLFLIRIAMNAMTIDVHAVQPIELIFTLPRVVFLSNMIMT